MVSVSLGVVLVVFMEKNNIKDLIVQKWLHAFLILYQLSQSLTGVLIQVKLSPFRRPARYDYQPISPLDPCLPHPGLE